MARIEEEFAGIRSKGVQLLAINTDALSADARADILDQLSQATGAGKVRLVLHSIALGNLKQVVPALPNNSAADARAALAKQLGISADVLRDAVNQLFEQGLAEVEQISDPAEYDSDSLLEDEDIAGTVYAMGTSLLAYVQQLHAKKLFAADARVLSMTSEGNTTAWRAYAAVSAAKCALEAISRSIALEFAPYGIRCNVVQAGVTDTPALRLIPGNDHLRARTRLRNPFGRLTTPEDVAGVVALLASDEAAWINGDVIRVDGGEHIAG